MFNRTYKQRFRKNNGVVEAINPNELVEETAARLKKCGIPDTLIDTYLARDRKDAEWDDKEIKKRRMAGKKYLTRAKDALLNVENLKRLALYRFEFTGLAICHDVITQMMKHHSIELFDTGSTILADRSYSGLMGKRICKVKDVWFLCDLDVNDISGDTKTVIYAPMWQRARAKVVLSEFMHSIIKRRRISKSMERNSLGGYSRINDKMIEQQQFVDQDIYDHLDSIFDRLVNDPDYYNLSGKRLKESILLHGVPGTGKTNLMTHLAAKYDMNVWTGNPEEFTNSTNAINDLKTSGGGHPVMILIEDIDADQELLLAEYVTAGKNNNNGRYNYSTFINALDGIDELENVIVVMTTNNKHMLIPSVIRQGRVDHAKELTLRTSAQIAEYVNTELSEYIASFPDGTFYISNIIDLRNCKSKEELDRLVSWLQEK